MNDENGNQNEPKHVWFKVRVASGPEYLVAVVSKHEKGEKTDFPQNRAVDAISTLLGADIRTTDLHPCEESEKSVNDLTAVESNRDDVKLWEISAR